MRALLAVFLGAVSSVSFSQTTTTTNCYASTPQSISCNTTQWQQPAEPVIAPPNVVGSFIDGRRARLQEENSEMQNELLRMQLEQQRRQQLVTERDRDQRMYRAGYALGKIETCFKSTAEADIRNDCVAMFYVSDPAFAKGFDELSTATADQEASRAFRSDVMQKVAKSGLAPR